MNFIEGKLNERRNIQTGYALDVLENIVVDAILDEAKKKLLQLLTRKKDTSTDTTRMTVKLGII